MKKTLLIGVVALSGLGLIVWKILHSPVELEANPIILGHGGMGMSSSLPLNSLRSVSKVLSYPINGTELDIRMTADEVLVAFHDKDLSLKTSCSGLISETTLIDLKDCENATWKTSEPIAQLDRLLSQKWKERTVFSLDLKGGQENSKVFIESVSDLISAYPDYRFLVESDNINNLLMLKALETNADLFYYAINSENGIQIASDNELTGISINWNLITQTQVLSAQKANLLVMVWGPSSVWSNRECLKLQSDIIQTDDVDSMIDLLELE